MNTAKYIALLVIIFISFQKPLYGQKGSAKMCVDAEPLCGSTLFSYPNTSGKNYAENGPDYGCVTVPNNPAWFYFQLSSSGDLELKISQSTALGGASNLDVDFVAYGPFDDPRQPCIVDLQEHNIVDCSFKTDYVEYLNISNAKAGEYYIMLITNFSRQAGFITVEQTAGSATTNCNVLNGPTKVSKAGCEGDDIILDVPTAADHFVWYQDDGTGAFNEIYNGSSPTFKVNASNRYRAEAYDSYNVFLEAYEYNVAFYERPSLPTTGIAPYTICSTQATAQFDLDSKKDEILNGQSPSSFSVTYYKTLEDAIDNIGAIPSLYNNTVLKEITIYARLQNILNPGANCYDITSFTIQTNLIPVFNLEPSYTLCVDTNGTEEIATSPLIDTGFDNINYSFVWSRNGVVLPTEASSTLSPSTEGNYSVTVTNILSGCAYENETVVIESGPPSITAKVTSGAFDESYTIAVEALGTGDYEFNIDDGPWQTSPVFEGIALGEHLFTARNIFGCGQSSVSLMVMDYPVFFTPNNDGYNDVWRVPGLKNLLRAEVNIYDRYGKLIKTLVANSEGWDGAFNGKNLPTDDYWFTITYFEPKDGQMKTFNSHFTLKR